MTTTATITASVRNDQLVYRFNGGSAMSEDSLTVALRSIGFSDREIVETIREAVRRGS